MVVLNVEELTKIFPPSTIALKNISFRTEHGEFFVILGPSGSGKTTLLRILAGIEKPSKGKIAIDGKVIVDVNSKTFIPPQKRDVSMVFQNWALYPNMKVFDNIAFPLTIKGLNKREINKKVREVSEILGISEILDRYPKQISGGQQQRVALARALVKEPSILLLDEPFSNLDARVRITARELVKKIQRKLGITTILVTHDQADAFALADRMMVLNHGVIQQIGQPKEVYERPKNIFIANFIGEPPMNILKVSISHDLISVLDLKLFNHTDKEIYIGIRPDEAEIVSNMPYDKKYFIGKVDYLEYLGSRRYASVKFKDVSIRVSAPFEISEGDEVYVMIKNYHVFDSQGFRLGD